MKLSAKQAAREIGKSTPTVTRAIKAGRISATRNDSGGFEIDPAELFRVFPRVTSNGGNVKGEILPAVTPDATPMLTRENEMLRARLEEKDEVIEDLRRRLDEEASERRKLTNILMEPRKKTFWQRLTGSG